MKNTINQTFLLLVCLLSLSNTTLKSQNKEYISRFYNYSIEIPDEFEIGTPNTPHCDLLFKNDLGASINVNVTKRDFKTKSTHDFSLEFFRKLLSNVSKNVRLFDEKKLVINNRKVYAYSMFIQYPNTDVLYQQQFIYFDETYQYIISLTCHRTLYEQYKNVFTQTGISLKFNPVN